MFFSPTHFFHFTVHSLECSCFILQKEECFIYLYFINILSRFISRFTLIVQIESYLIYVEHIWAIWVNVWICSCAPVVYARQEKQEMKSVLGEGRRVINQYFRLERVFYLEERKEQIYHESPTCFTLFSFSSLRDGRQKLSSHRWIVTKADMENSYIPMKYSLLRFPIHSLLFFIGFSCSYYKQHEHATF